MPATTACITRGRRAKSRSCWPAICRRAARRRKCFYYGLACDICVLWNALSSATLISAIVARARAAGAGVRRIQRFLPSGWALGSHYFRGECRSELCSAELFSLCEMGSARLCRSCGGACARACASSAVRKAANALCAGASAQIAVFWLLVPNLAPIAGVLLGVAGVAALWRPAPPVCRHVPWVCPC